MKSVKQVLLLCLAFLLQLPVLSGCKSVKPPLSNLPPSTIDAPVLPISTINAAVSADLNNLINKLNTTLPRGMNSNGDVGEGCRVNYRWSFDRSDLQVSLSGNTITLQAKGYYSASANVRPCCGYLCPWVHVGCGDKSNFGRLKPELLKAGFKKEDVDIIGTMLGPGNIIDSTSNVAFNRKFLKNERLREDRREVNIKITSTVSLSDDYSIISNSVLTDFTPVNRCELTFLKIDVTNKILDVARPLIQNALKNFDSEVAKIKIKDKVEPAWQKLFTPIKVGDYGYLLLNPSEVHFGDLNGDATNKVRFTVGIGAKPVFSLADPGPIAASPMPNISKGSLANGYNIYLDNHLQYAPLSSLLTAELNKLGKLDLGGKKYVYLTDATVFGVNNKDLLLKVRFYGKAYGIRYKGWLYLTGEPSYNPLTKDLALQNVQYDVETKNLLLKKAAWIFNSQINAEIAKRSHWNVGAQMDDLKAKLAAELNRDLGSGTKLEGTVANLGIVGILAAKDFIVVRVNATGSIEVKTSQARMMGSSN